MENASKALMIAGGILLAILTLSLVVYMMTAVTSMADAQDAEALARQKTEFNKGYEAYNKRMMYGTDVITVMNKAVDNNAKGENLVHIEVRDENDQIMNITNAEEFKKNIFECTDIIYDEDTGLVNIIKFKRKVIDI